MLKHIFVPIKTHSLRCPNKNFVLLRHTLDYIAQTVGDDAFVHIITDSSIFEPIVNSYTFRTSYWIEDNHNSPSELHSIDKYLIKLDHSPTSRVVILPVTQPCRSENLLTKLLRGVSLKPNDLITSYVEITDRSIFEIKENKFLIPNTKRCGSYCTTKQIADGAIYYTTASFLHKCIQSEDTNYHFWNKSNLTFIRNYAPLVDIDTNEDLDNYLKYYKQ